MKFQDNIIFFSILILSFSIDSCKKTTIDDFQVCNKIQEMSLRCEPQILAIFNKNSAVLSNAKVAEFDYKLISSRIHKKIMEQKALKQCNRYRDSSSEEDRERYYRMKACLESNECNRFAECILRF